MLISITRLLHELQPLLSFLPLHPHHQAVAEAKESPASQVRKLYTEVQKIAQDATQVDLFFQEVRHFAMYSIVVGAREPVVEKTVKFVASLCTYPAGIADKERERREKENQEKESEGRWGFQGRGEG